MKQTKKQISHTLWIMLLKKHFKYSPEILDKMSKMKFDKDGNVVEGNKAYKYAIKHFPSLLTKLEQWRSK